MKMSKKAGQKIGCLTAICFYAIAIMQVVFITLKCTGVTDLSWWAVLSPSIVAIVLPFAAVVAVIIALIPSALWKAWKTARRVDAEAAKYGMKRQPGESTSDLKKRIVRRNMLGGNYSRKDIKDIILAKYPAVGSCMISINNYTRDITLVLCNAYADNGFTDDELTEIAAFAADYIPEGYSITARNK